MGRGGGEGGGWAVQVEDEATPGRRGVAGVDSGSLGRRADGGGGDNIDPGRLWEVG